MNEARVVVATVSIFLTVGIPPGEEPTVSQNTFDHGYHTARPTKVDPMTALRYD